jgi:multidrug efflux pump subunit AcrB
MALAIGMLLDNSIVVLENIYRLRAQGKDPATAVLQGTKEVYRSIIAATLTTITVFIPFVFSSDYLIKLIGKHVGIAIIATLSVSLIVALLLIPTFAYHTMRADRIVDHMRSGIKKLTLRNRSMQIYMVLLKACLRFPARTVVCAVLIFLITVSVSIAISLNILTEVDSDEFNIYLTMPAGSTLEVTDKAVAELENNLSGIQETRDIISTIYEEEAVVTLSMHDDYQEYNNRTLAEIKAELQNRISGFDAAEVSLDEPQSSTRFGGGPRQNPGGGLLTMLGIGAQMESIIIRGSDFDRLRTIADDLQYYLEELSTIQAVTINVNENRPEIHLEFDTQLLSELGISLANVATELNTFQTEFSSGVTFQRGTEEHDIIIKETRSAVDKDRSVYELIALPIPDPQNNQRSLGELSDIDPRQLAGFGRSRDNI